MFKPGVQAMGTPAARLAVSRRHRGVPKTAEQRARTSASLRGHPISPETRAKISASLKGRRPPPERLAKQLAGLAQWRTTTKRMVRSQLEIRAAALFPGFEPQVHIGRHVFDYASPDRLTLVEVNGCYWHNHRSSDSTCPLPGRPQPTHQDERTRAIAARAGAVLVELWECQEARWPQQLAAQLR